jgi:UDPglucose--hexose-1-phosphate uridylyltransferase
VEGKTGQSPGDNPFLPGHEAETPPEIYALRAAGSAANSPGWQLRVFPNRYPALQPEGDARPQLDGFYLKMCGVGAHEVLVETPDPNVSFAELSLEQIRAVLEGYRARLSEIYRDSRIAQVLIFKNHGPQSGATQSHSHSQIIGLPLLSPVLERELDACNAHWQVTERSLLLDISGEEQSQATRVVYEDEALIAFCPYASEAPYEVLLVAKQPAWDYRLADQQVLAAMAAALKLVIGALKAVMQIVSYNLILQLAPNPDNAEVAKRAPNLSSAFQWYFRLIPRSTLQGGFEWGSGMQINTVAPETAAARLRAAAVPPA